MATPATPEVLKENTHPPPDASLLVFRNPLCHTPSSLSSPRHVSAHRPLAWLRDCSHLEGIDGFFALASSHRHMLFKAPRESSPGSPLGLACCLLGWLWHKLELHLSNFFWVLPPNSFIYTNIGISLCLVTPSELRPLNSGQIYGMFLGNIQVPWQGFVCFVF